MLNQAIQEKENYTRRWFMMDIHTKKTVKRLMDPRYITNVQSESHFQQTHTLS